MASHARNRQAPSCSNDWDVLQDVLEAQELKPVPIKQVRAWMKWDIGFNDVRQSAQQSFWRWYSHDQLTQAAAGLVSETGTTPALLSSMQAVFVRSTVRLRLKLSYNATLRVSVKRRTKEMSLLMILILFIVPEVRYRHIDMKYRGGRIWFRRCSVSCIRYPGCVCAFL
jgi:hypothetical protein